VCRRSAGRAKEGKQLLGLALPSARNNSLALVDRLDGVGFGLGSSDARSKGKPWRGAIKAEFLCSAFDCHLISARVLQSVRLCRRLKHAYQPFRRYAARSGRSTGSARKFDHRAASAAEYLHAETRFTGA
jgi:hypothetical protein